MKLAVRLLGVLLTIETCVACARSEPPGARCVEAAARPVGARAAASPDGATTTPTPDDKLREAGSEVYPPVHRADTADAAPAPATSDNDSLVDTDGQPRPQTSDKPVAEDQKFQARVSLLCDAIIEGKPEKAHDAFFPLIAYRQVKAIDDPDRDYRLRLMRHFDRDILDYHRRVQKRSAPLKCQVMRVPEAQARWMKPGSEYNRVGYFRVLRSQLDLTDANGNTFSLEVTSLISWRGQWYVVHLNGFE